MCRHIDEFGKSSVMAAVTSTRAFLEISDFFSGAGSRQLRGTSCFAPLTALSLLRNQRGEAMKHRVFLVLSCLSVVRFLHVRINVRLSVEWFSESGA
jgi:hypothetical protein